MNMTSVSGMENWRRREYIGDQGGEKVERALLSMSWTVVAVSGDGGSGDGGSGDELQRVMDPSTMFHSLSAFEHLRVVNVCFHCGDTLTLSRLSKRSSYIIQLHLVHLRHLFLVVFSSKAILPPSRDGFSWPFSPIIALISRRKFITHTNNT
jgi:hypothetical protein